METTDYDKQAADFCATTGLTIKKQYDGHRAYFKGEKEKRAVWIITFERQGKKPYTFTYGDSISNSYALFDTNRIPAKRVAAGLPTLRPTVYNNSRYESRPVHPEPSDYDVLACIEKRGCMSFQDFCDNYGYNSDSIKGKAIWEACLEQAAAIQAMFSEKEIEQLEKIQ